MKYLSEEIKILWNGIVLLSDHIWEFEKYWSRVLIPIMKRCWPMIQYFIPWIIPPCLIWWRHSGV